MDAEHVNVRRVGRVLGKMRWRAERTARAKAWAITLSDLQRWAQAYGVEWPRELRIEKGVPLPANGTNGSEGITALGAEGASCEEDGELPLPENDRGVFWL